MRARVSSLLVGVWAVALMAVLPRGSHAQGGGGGGGGGGGDEDGGSDEDVTLDIPVESETDEDGSGGSPPLVCDTDGTSAHYEEFLEGEGSVTVRWAGTTTGCPNHVNWPFNPGFTVASPTNTSIPAYPMLIADGGTTDLSSAAGAVGIMLNGVAMFSAWANVPVEEYEDTAFYQTSEGFDPCGGHHSATGTYHYHNTAGCLQEQAGGTVGEHSPLLGWAYDGFPYYGQLGPGGVEMKMCGADGAHSTHCLDVCSGYEAFTDEDTFAYRYYTSCGYDESFFPFTTNCFRGCCPEGMTCNDQVEACGEGAEVGYSDDHVPEATTSLHDQYDAMLIEGDDTSFIESNFTVNCTLYLGADSLAASSAGSVGTTPPPTPASTAGTTPPPTSMSTVGTTPSPTSKSTVGTIASPTAAWSSVTESPEATVASVTEPPAPERPGGIPVATPSPGADSLAASSAVDVGKTPSPSPVSAVETAPSPTAVGSPDTESPEATGASATESPVPGIAGDIPVATPSPGSAANGDTAGDEASGASGAFGYASVVLAGAITAAAAILSL